MPAYGRSGYAYSDGLNRLECQYTSSVKLKFLSKNGLACVGTIVRENKRFRRYGVALWAGLWAALWVGRRATRTRTRCPTQLHIHLGRHGPQPHQVGNRRRWFRAQLRHRFSSKSLWVRAADAVGTVGTGVGGAGD